MTTLAPVLTSGARTFTTYRRHNCTRSHRTARTLAGCIWPRAHWIAGTGGWATLATCRPRVLTVELFPTRLEAERQLDLIRGSGCGGACYLGGAERAGKHRLIRLADAAGAA